MGSRLTRVWNAPNKRRRSWRFSFRRQLHTRHLPAGASNPQTFKWFWCYPTRRSQQWCSGREQGDCCSALDVNRSLSMQPHSADPTRFLRFPHPNRINCQSTPVHDPSSCCPPLLPSSKKWQLSTPVGAANEPLTEIRCRFWRNPAHFFPHISHNFRSNYLKFCANIVQPILYPGYFFKIFMKTINVQIEFSKSWKFANSLKRRVWRGFTI